MNKPQGHRSGTILLRDLSIVAGPTDARLVTALTPVRLADLLLVAPVSRRAGLALLEPGGHTSTVSLLRGTVPVAEFRVGAEVANATVVRLAVIAGLDPLIEVGTLEGNANIRRVLVRTGVDLIEVLVSVGASSRGLHAEVRVLSVNGHAPDHRSWGQLRRCTCCGALQPHAQTVCEQDGAPMVEIEDAPVPGGTVGMYRIVSSLGEGAGGSVLAAEHAVLGRRMAIKVLHRNLANDPDMAHRFLSEGRAACRLRHRSVIEVTDFGVLHDGRPYLVMEELNGQSLAAMLASIAALPPAAALLLAREIAEALAAAHGVGIAHNDLKPANVIILDGSTDEAPRLKLIDFGCASLVGTVESGLFGTPGYMAPERIYGFPSDGRADIYALGMILYEMIAGDAPHDAPSVRGLLLAHVKKPLPPLTSPMGALPPAVHRLVARASAARPEERHQSAGELVADIDRALAVLGREGSWRWCP